MKTGPSEGGKEFCQNCGEEVRWGGMLKSENLRYLSAPIALVNHVHGTEYSDLCEACGKEVVDETVSEMAKKQDENARYVRNNITHFPIFTVTPLPETAKFRLITLVTANVTVGTGLFNEVSQGFSDFFGRANTSSGMTLKVNQGEAIARAMLARKARAAGGNCVLGVDIDYGTTGNNSTTVNMQGTAAIIENIGSVLTTEAAEKASQLEIAFQNADELAELLRGCS